MNKIDEYKNKINYNVWEDIAPLKIRDRREDPKKIEAIRKVILGCSSDGGEIQDRLACNREVENCRVTPLLVKYVNANDNFFAADNVVYANFGLQKAAVSYEDYALAA